MQAPALRVQRLFRPVHRGLERLGAASQRHVIEIFGKNSPVALDEFARRELFQRLARQGTEGGAVNVIERHAHNAASGNEARTGQVEQPWQQLASGQITGGPEEDHDLRILRTYPGRNLCHSRLSNNSTAAL
jgi:hypothetical protein